MDGTNRIDELEQKFIENPRRYFAPLANEYRKAGNPRQAIEICRAHLSQLPGHMSGQIVYGQALFEGGEYEQAQTVFENALAMDRENLVALRHLGDLALHRGETAAARQWYSRFLEIDPKDANVIALVDEIDAAAEAQSSTTDAEPASTTTPESVQPMPEPSAQLDHVDDQADMLIAEELGYPVPPAHAFVTETMAELYLAQGFRDRAVSVYRQLVEVRPEDERLRNRLAELEQPTPEDGLTAEPVEARREEPPSIESPGAPREDESSPSIEAPTPSPEVQVPSEESGAGETPPVDSPPSDAPEAEPDSVESVVSDEPRAEPEGFAATEHTASEKTTERAGEIASDARYAFTEQAADAPYEFAEQAPDSVYASGEHAPDDSHGLESSDPPDPIETPEAFVASDVPRSVTVREFFASLGRRKPAARSNGSSSNGTGYAQSGWNSHNDSSSAADAKAAAALAGAFGGAPGATSYGDGPASPVTGKESEEDVARFRAWLDGLTTQ
jgi:tetratricopeptide (TPR) repeat protein